ncbi:MAG: hypothetical protein IKP47_08290 [Ruminococcus sp.]|nr:hypothetical protein [Ruminococcus sp.]
MTIDGILDLMLTLLDKSTAVPFSNKKMVDQEQMREYIDSIRANMPDEINLANETVREQKSIIDNANREAEQIIRKAEEKAKVLVSQEEIIKQAREVAKQELEKAREEADGIVADARAQEKKIKAALAVNLEKTLSDAQKAIANSGKALAKSMDDINSTKEAIMRANGTAEQ